jgi:hypothetical protein
MHVRPTNIMSYIIYDDYILVTLVPCLMTYTKCQSQHQGMYYCLLKKNEHNDILSQCKHMSKEYRKICVSYEYIVTGFGKHDLCVTM